MCRYVFMLLSLSLSQPTNDKNNHNVILTKEQSNNTTVRIHLFNILFNELC